MVRSRDINLCKCSRVLRKMSLVEGLCTHPWIMSSFNEDEPTIDITNQIIYDQYIAHVFDYPKSLRTTHVGDLVLKLTWFGVVSIVGLDIMEAQMKAWVNGFMMNIIFKSYLRSYLYWYMHNHRW